MTEALRFRFRPGRIAVSIVSVVTAVAVTLLMVWLLGDEEGETESIFDGTVHIATAFDQPGFSLHTNHTDRGFDMDVASYLGEQLGFTPKFQDVTHAAREREIQENTADLVIASYSITPERKEKVDFVGPYFVTRQGFLVRKDYDGIKTEKDVARKTICSVEGTTPVSVVMPRGTIVIQESDYSTCVKKLQDGKVDAVFTDESLLFGYVEQMKTSKVPLKVVSNVSMGLINRYGIGLRKGNVDDCRKLLKVLKKYVVEEWASDVKAQLPSLVAAHPADWENLFKPDPQDLDTYSSCKP